MTRRRVGNAGVTLVEMLVVLVLIGVMAGAVALSIGPADRGGGAGREARLLAARLDRAADEVLLDGAPVALVWTPDNYRFLTLSAGDWVPHPVAILGQPHAFGRGLSFLGEAAAGGRFVLRPDLVPADDAPLTLAIGASGSAAGDSDRVRFDGSRARLLARGQS